MNKCPNCGYEGNDQFCPYCGSQMQAASSSNADSSSQNGYNSQQNYSGQSNGYNQQNNYSQTGAGQENYSADSFMSGGFGSYQPSGMNIPPEYRPIGMWGYFGYSILFAIPCIGFIMLCVFAFGGTVNLNLRNYARSYFCLILVSIGLFLLTMLFGLGGAMSAMGRYY